MNEQCSATYKYVEDSYWKLHLACINCEMDMVASDLAFMSNKQEDAFAGHKNVWTWIKCKFHVGNQLR